MKKTKLPPIAKRLKLILEMTPKCDIISDIGCDHAYVSIHLIKKEIAKFVYACDIRKGPLEIAKRNIEKFDCKNQIETILSDGLDGIIDKDFDSCIIAGMGGEMICDILNKHLDKIKNDTLFIMQPMSKIEILREYLYKNKFLITDEKLCLEDKRIYNVICAKKTSENIEVSNDIYYLIGKKLIEKRDELLELLLNKRILEYENVKKAIDESENDNNKKINYVNQRIEKLKNIREEIL